MLRHVDHVAQRQREHVGGGVVSEVYFLDGIDAAQTIGRATAHVGDGREVVERRRPSGAGYPPPCHRRLARQLAGVTTRAKAVLQGGDVARVDDEHIVAAPPIITSAPPLPMIVSSPAPAAKVSAALVPVCVSALAGAHEVDRAGGKGAAIRN
jgi:hypothetical protein